MKNYKLTISHREFAFEHIRKCFPFKWVVVFFIFFFCVNTLFSQGHNLNCKVKWIKVYAQDPNISLTSEIVLGDIKDVVIKNQKKDGYLIVKIKDREMLCEFQEAVKKSSIIKDTSRFTPKIAVEIKLKNKRKKTIFIDYFSNVSNDHSICFMNNEELLNVVWKALPSLWKIPFSER